MKKNNNGIIDKQIKTLEEQVKQAQNKIKQLQALQGTSSKMVDAIITVQINRYNDLEILSYQVHQPKITLKEEEEDASRAQIIFKAQGEHIYISFDACGTKKLSINSNYSELKQIVNAPRYCKDGAYITGILLFALSEAEYQTWIPKLINRVSRHSSNKNIYATCAEFIDTFDTPEFLAALYIVEANKTYTDPITSEAKQALKDWLANRLKVNTTSGTTTEPKLLTTTKE